jgi:K+-sensing histidine kinase KdpD
MLHDDPHNTNNRAGTGTFYAPAWRAPRNQLINELALVSNNPVIDGLIKTVGGLLAILNEHRQVLLVNQAFLNMLHIDDPESLLGLRPGEAIQCVHSHDEPAGCGTTRFCASCGAAIAIVSSLSVDHPEERTCVTTVTRDGKTADLYLKVKSYPFVVDGKRFVLLFMSDVSTEQKRAALERAFYHDVSNIVMGLVGATEALEEENAYDAGGLVGRIKTLTSRLADEVAMQKVLSSSELSEYEPDMQWMSVAHVIGELREIFANHPAADGRTLILQAPSAGTRIRTDFSMLVRVLSNMVVNALEATKEKGTVTLWIDDDDASITFCVRNETAIAKDAVDRVFQRNFSTKGGEGRGLGTYTMKLLCEKYLDAKISFTTSDREGAIFRLQLPGLTMD